MHAAAIFRGEKSLLDWLLQLKQFRVQGKMHFNDSREWVKLNTLSGIFFPTLLSLPSQCFCLRCSPAPCLKPPPLLRRQLLLKNRGPEKGPAACDGADPPRSPSSRTEGPPKGKANPELAAATSPMACQEPHTHLGILHTHHLCFSQKILARKITLLFCRGANRVVKKCAQGSRA